MFTLIKYKFLKLNLLQKYIIDLNILELVFIIRKQFLQIIKC